jgi:hypothetical protein
VLVSQVLQPLAVQDCGPWPGAMPGDDARRTATSLYEIGVRHLVLSGGLDVAAAFLTARLVDRVVAYLPGGPASRRPNLATPWPLLLPGFVVKGATRMNGFVRIDAEFKELS